MTLEYNKEEDIRRWGYSCSLFIDLEVSQTWRPTTRSQRRAKSSTASGVGLPFINRSVELDGVVQPSRGLCAMQCVHTFKNERWGRNMFVEWRRVLVVVGFPRSRSGLRTREKIVISAHGTRKQLQRANYRITIYGVAWYTTSRRLATSSTPACILDDRCVLVRRLHSRVFCCHTGSYTIR